VKKVLQTVFALALLIGAPAFVRVGYDDSGVSR